MRMVVKEALAFVAFGVVIGIPPPCMRPHGSGMLIRCRPLTRCCLGPLAWCCSQREGWPHWTGVPGHARAADPGAAVGVTDRLGRGSSKDGTLDVAGAGVPTAGVLYSEHVRV